MKIKLIATLLAGLVATSAGADEVAPLKTDKEKTSYAVGVDIGRNFHGVGADVEVEQMIRGLRDGLKGAKPALPEIEIRQLMGTYRAELGQKQQAAMQKARVENKEKGDQFQGTYKKKDGVTTMPNGLMYRVLKAGTGKKPGETDTVQVNYVGRLVDGREFDASEPGKPASFKLNAGVIQGWRAALEQMAVGAKWEVVIPPSLAYGDRGAGRDIPPAATLIFDIELVSIAEAAVPAPVPPSQPSVK
jgi:FKBP-type peptidyl-prolyl cis-trans isomerase FklB